MKKTESKDMFNSFLNATGTSFFAQGTSPDVSVLLEVGMGDWTSPVAKHTGQIELSPLTNAMFSTSPPEALFCSTMTAEKSTKQVSLGKPR